MNRDLDELADEWSTGDKGPLLLEPRDHLDQACLGLVTRSGQEPFFVYDIDRVIEGHVHMGMSYEDAADWVSFNTLGAWAGPGTPGFLRRPEAWY